MLCVGPRSRDENHRLSGLGVGPCKLLGTLQRNMRKYSLYTTRACLFNSMNIYCLYTYTNEYTHIYQQNLPQPKWLPYMETQRLVTCVSVAHVLPLTHVHSSLLWDRLSPLPLGSQSLGFDSLLLRGGSTSEPNPKH